MVISSNLLILFLPVKICSSIFFLPTSNFFLLIIVLFNSSISRWFLFYNLSLYWFSLIGLNYAHSLSSLDMILCSFFNIFKIVVLKYFSSTSNICVSSGIISTYFMPVNKQYFLVSFHVSYFLWKLDFLNIIWQLCKSDFFLSYQHLLLALLVIVVAVCSFHDYSELILYSLLYSLSWMATTSLLCYPSGMLITEKRFP